MACKADEIQSMLRDVVRHGRTGGYSEAASGMNKCVQQLQGLFGAGVVRTEDLSKLAYSLETIAMMQQSDDWVAVADIIEYEFAPLLEQACE